MAQFHDAPARYLGLMREALPLYDRLQEELVRASADVSASRVLDLGSGTGETARRCLAAHPSASLVALDASAEMLGVAAAVLDRRAELRLGRLEDGLPEGAFDLVVSALAVHHLDGMEKADLFRRIRARLVPGGRFVMADVIVPGTPVECPSPLEPTVDKPDRVEDILRWLREAGLRPAVSWAEQDLVVIVAVRPSIGPPVVHHGEVTGMDDATTTKAPHSSIAPGTGVGSVHLSVTDRDRATAFYRDLLGLEVMADDGEIRLGTQGRELVALHPGASAPVPSGTTGLYHLAIVVPSRRELARVVARLMGRRYPNYPTDHVLTKSDYLSDPDGNGIEVYAETPEDGTWFMSDDEFAARDSTGTLRSGRDPIDVTTLFAELEEGDPIDLPLPEGTRMGHVHLHVRDLDEAVRFWSDLIGFDVMGRSRRWGAAFISAGGYHHHLGLNTWAGEGAPPLPPGVSGLRHFTIEVPAASDIAEVVGRLESGGIELSPAPGRGFFVQDPSGNRAHILALRG